MITYNIELQFNNQSSQNYWINLLNQVKDCYNCLSNYVFNDKPILGIKSIHNKYYSKLRNQFSSLPSQMIIKIEQEVISMYKSIKSNKHNLTSPSVKNNLSLRLDKRLYSNFTVNSIKLTSEIKNKRTEVKLLNYDKSLELFSKYEVCDPLIFYRNNKFYLSVSFNVPQITPTNEDIVGVDLGCRRLFTTSEGKCLLGNEFNHYKRKIRYNKRKLQSKKKHSHSARNKLKKLSHKEHNFSKKYIELAANKLLSTTQSSTIVLEDLTKIKQSTNRKGSSHNNRISQVPFCLFKQIISYKAPLVGKQVVTVNPAYTSQNDFRGITKGIRKNRRYYTTDNLVFDSDWNAAINIANKFSEHPISSLMPLDGTLDLLGRLLSINHSSN